jgi:diguanylate cyclase (GGDEF)-like protein
MRARFQTKIIALMILVVGAAQLATFAVVHVATARSVGQQLEDELEVGERVWKRFYERRGEQLLEGAAVLADDFGFKAAVASGDPPTMQSALANQGSRINAQASLLLSAEGDWQAGLLDAPPADQLHAIAALLRQARQDGFAVSVVVIGGRLYRMALVPVMAPQLIGWVGIGTDFGDAFARDFHDVTALDASFVAVERGQTRVFASSLAPPARMALQALPAAELGADRKVRPVRLGADQYYALTEKLDPAGDGGVMVVLQGSLDRALAPYQALKQRILILSGLAAALALLVAALLGRTVSRPMGALVSAARRVQSGDYTGEISVPGRDEFSRLADTFGQMQRDIGAREDRILDQARRDSLTGLPNRSWARERLAQSVHRQRADGDFTAVLIFDLARFKEINDTLGHEFADLVLVEVGKRLLEGTGEGDLVARLGSDVFLVVLEGLARGEVMRRVHVLLNELRRPLDLTSSHINLDASVGVALCPVHGADAETLLRRADIALFDAKAQNLGIALYQPGRDELHLRRLQLMEDLRHSITRNELHLRFQPKLDVATSRVVQVEALLRWQHGSLGAIGPDEFIPLAEHSGFIHELTRYVLDEALGTNAAWRRQGLDLGLAINLSAMDLMDADLPDYVQELLAAHGVPAGKVILEVTESAVMRDVDYAVRMLQRLRDGGVRLAIDDFGTGYSSLAQLKRMPVDELKIDKSFVMQLVDGSDDAVIVRSTIELAHNMGLSVVAEGVEGDVAMGLLRGYGCDMAQGYLFSAPLRDQELVQWCNAWAQATSALHGDPLPTGIA